MMPSMTLAFFFLISVSGTFEMRPQQNSIANTALSGPGLARLSGVHALTHSARSRSSMRLWHTARALMRFLSSTKTPTPRLLLPLTSLPAYFRHINLQTRGQALRRPVICTLLSLGPRGCYPISCYCKFRL